MLHEPARQSFIHSITLIHSPTESNNCRGNKTREKTRKSLDNFPIEYGTIIWHCERSPGIYNGVFRIYVDTAVRSVWAARAPYLHFRHWSLLLSSCRLPTATHSAPMTTAAHALWGITADSLPSPFNPRPMQRRRSWSTREIKWHGKGNVISWKLIIHGQLAVVAIQLGRRVLLQAMFCS